MNMKTSIVHSVLFFCTSFHTASAVLPPDVREAQEKQFTQSSEQAKKNAPEILDIKVIKINTSRNYYIAEARVLHVEHSQAVIKEGELIKIKYLDISISARKHNEKTKKEKIFGPGFKPVLYLLKEGDNVRAYLRIDSSNPKILILAAGTVSFKPLTQTHCSKPYSEPCNQNYAPVCAQKKLHVYCIKAPCNYFTQLTYSNHCLACSDKDVSSYSKGTCEQKK